MNRIDELQEANEAFEQENSALEKELEKYAGKLDELSQGFEGASDAVKAIRIPSDADLDQVESAWKAERDTALERFKRCFIYPTLTGLCLLQS